ncbi:aspartate-semialdehyde dehydrogenase [Elizabethkingia meningoseptica]|uniref:Aspartate-semialdehyde dehydrogenase n=1 Tax=Elizabethkingia meningoseptica TaxID=238 RepID=A0A1V3TVM1_ELIME|nr:MULTISPECIES: aspartate-semialdehyde dehydrogenase [Elizabethkingia]AQX04586.1 aspartate-semialdehyde dehydrogenase [Elizabethkingia meningoseptica]AQX12049.1 aspartate-semialdehyde dehydrogenase [Elizabethkingia meningoseptica]AQX46630.1 aspartate-semialdehyde dehydrogenase [Elizabethkingia meningoseptica]EJK5328468.1 aspartate-semialdehyde dehydrogenase [Elizabethkingia meningoseptica]EOR31405.1 aspartate-semialdehyde dehydrogenase [Elizabethkingia meningoseptica ATCC 13253 = NBRC 12535]
MKIAVVGATGMVGQVMLRVLEERNLPVTELIPVASERSVGKKITFKGQEYAIVSMQEAIDRKPEIALFSAGGETSKQFAPKFAEAGTTVIDNSSAWRMEVDKKLVVPEINANVLTKEDKIIANPNCSTIQLVMVLAPLNKKYDIKRVIVSTYQSVTGTGKNAVDQLNAEIKGETPEMVYPYQIFKNALPHCDVFADDDYTKEEIKLMKEPKKIMGDDTFSLTATAVRVPVQGGHSESVNIEFENEFELEEVRKILSATPGVVVLDDVQNKVYPMPLEAEGKDDVFVGRIRRDLSQPKTLNLWIVADNLRKGAATNAVQIAEYLVANELV